MKLLLASQSPRRKELLHKLGYEFETVSLNCEEIYPEDMDANAVAGYLSALKAQSFRILQNDEVLLTADTIVALDQEILGKPQNAEEAFEMLMKLSGKTHQVFTGITVRTVHEQKTATDVAAVSFKNITPDEARWYIEHFKPFDKAGSYGIQEWLGMAKVERIEGSYYTIMGLPTHLVYSLINEIQLR